MEDEDCVRIDLGDRGVKNDRILRVGVELKRGASGLVGERGVEGVGLLLARGGITGVANFEGEGGEGEGEWGTFAVPDVDLEAEAVVELGIWSVVPFFGIGFGVVERLDDFSDETRMTPLFGDVGLLVFLGLAIVFRLGDTGDRNAELIW